jgi:hypothetical protein
MDTEQKAREILRWAEASKHPNFDSHTIEGIYDYICNRRYTPSSEQIKSVNNVYEKFHIANYLRKLDETNKMSNFRMMLPKASKFTISSRAVPTESSIASPSSLRVLVAKPNKCITVMANKTVCGVPTATQYCGRHKPEEPKVNPVNSTNKCITVRKNTKMSVGYLRIPSEFEEKEEERRYFKQGLEEDRIARDDHLKKTRFVTLPKASNLSVPPLVPLKDSVPILSIKVVPEASNLSVAPLVPLEDDPVPILSIKVVPEASETYMQEEEEEIRLQKPKRKLIRKNIIVEDEEEPKKSKRDRPLINYNVSDAELGVDQKLYEIKEILGFQKDHDKVQYLISWKGYTETTWEPEKNLVGIDCPVLISKFLKKNKKYL